MKISLHAIVKILTANNISFLISRADDIFLEKVIRFSSTNQKGSHMCIKEWQDEVFYDRFMKNDGEVCMHYLLEKQSIISICENWHNLLKKETNAK